MPKPEDHPDWPRPKPPKKDDEVFDFGVKNLMENRKEAILKDSSTLNMVGCEKCGLTGPCSDCRSKQTKKDEENLYEALTKLEREEKIKHPKHYNRGKIEVGDFIRDQELNFYLGSAVKYICRAGYKPGASFEDDIRKAIQSLQNELDFLTCGVKEDEKE